MGDAVDSLLRRRIFHRVFHPLFLFRGPSDQSYSYHIRPPEENHAGQGTSSPGRLRSAGLRPHRIRPQKTFQERPSMIIDDDNECEKADRFTGFAKGSAMGLRMKIVSGFLVLALMLLLAGAWSVFELRNIAGSVPKILEDHYKSIRAAKIMIEALEREDSAVLLRMTGQGDKGRETGDEADRRFLEGFDVARNNVTMPGEGDLIEKIRKEYETYKALWIMPIAGTGHEGDLRWYLESAFPAFLQVKSSVQQLSDMNDKGMYDAALSLGNKAHRSTMPGVVAMIAAMVLSLIFSYFVNVFMVSPIIRITQGIRSFLETGAPFQVRIATSDEIGELASSVADLTSKIPPIVKKP
jgi:HAMP domain-containing protein